MAKNELEFLKKHLKGPILREIIDPKDYDIDDIMKSYFREILFLAGRYSRPTVDYEDLVGEGLIGLLDAVKRFDIKKANNNPRAFHNLAIVRIKGTMFEFFLANNTQYKIPSRMSRALNIVEQIRNVIASTDCVDDANTALLNFECPEFDRTVSEEKKRKLTVAKTKLKNLAKGAGKSYEDMVLVVLGVERDIEDFETDQGEADASPENAMVEYEYLHKFLNSLNKDARLVIEKLLDGDTLKDVGEDMGFTRERARQIKAETIKYFARTRMYQDAQDS